jgi:hypothetical protein
MFTPKKYSMPSKLGTNIGNQNIIILIIGWDTITRGVTISMS